jgi:hypothetical protein
VVCAIVLGSMSCGLFKKGGNCQPCRESTPTDIVGCDAGLNCSTFSGTSGLRQLCHKPGVTSC